MFGVVFRHIEADFIFSGFAGESGPKYGIDERPDFLRADSGSFALEQKPNHALRLGAAAANICVWALVLNHTVRCPGHTFSQMKRPAILPESTADLIWLAL